jgi:Helicase conserved C-terminal domain/Type III restriction enzyme, res subunit
VNSWRRKKRRNGFACSDETVGQLKKKKGGDETDEFVSDAYETGLPTHTEPEEIASLLRRKGPKVVFATYQSGDKLAEAARLAKVKFDLVIFDEAHRTTGPRYKKFAALLRDNEFAAKRRLFMTATERRVNGEADVYSMDDNEGDYGKRFFTMSYKEAIDCGAITDYEILTVLINDVRVRRLVATNRLLNLHRDLTEAEARTVATGIALKQAMRKYKIKKALSFHSSISGADDFCKQQDVLDCLRPVTINFHVSSKMTAGERKNLLDEFSETTSKPALMTNARCLTEGVDVPAIDCVVFADPRQSTVDIIQAAGRAMRRSKGKKRGYILIPLVVPNGVDFNTFVETTPFREVGRIISALSVTDTRIADELRVIGQGRIPSARRRRRIIRLVGDVPVGMRMSLQKLSDAITTRLWEKVARVNPRPFEEAREFARGRKLKSFTEWRHWSKTDAKPSDIPANPQQVYRNQGWISWGDWLGTGYVAVGLRNYLPFRQARTYVQRLKLKSVAEWQKYCKSGKKPEEIPAHPYRFYEGEGWSGIRDWIGAEELPVYLPFKKARAYARKLGLRNQEAWIKHCKSGKKPKDIPAHPGGVYKGNGWSGYGDWLGTGTVAAQLRDYLPFKEARAYVRRLGIEGQLEWKKYCRSGKKPEEIPNAPRYVYKDKWVGMFDWLGNGQPRGHMMGFKKARAYARRLGLKSKAKWAEFCRSGNKPANIPANPQRYKEWISWSDWLGTDTVAPQLIQFRTFKQARAYARSLNLESRLQWQRHWESRKRPLDIPASPRSVYIGKGWAGWPDWLGTKTLAQPWRLKEAA